MNNYPKYPIYIPSKDRSHAGHTIKHFLKDNVKFKIVIEPDQFVNYEKEFGNENLLILPENNMKLLGSRLWIREHSIKNGYKRHWQFDDNIRSTHRVTKGKIIEINANIAIYAIEQFTDRYINIGVSGFNYEMFVMNTVKKPISLNTKVFSASLINNEMPYKWRLFYNDDSDLCLQALSNGWCTVQFNTFCVGKIATMKVKGGNTNDMYKIKNGRLKMARTLEEIWPDLVKVVYKFNRPQHSINWKYFKDLKLIRRDDIDWHEIRNTKYEIKLKQIKEIKSESLSKWFDENK